MFRHKTDKQKIAKAIGYTFKTERLLLQALTRTSALEEGKQQRDVGDFQRLEFVGDKILGLIIADLLYDCHPTWREGRLTQRTSELVRNKGPLAIIARKLGLGDFLIMGYGEELSHLREDNKVLSDAMEALLGALWLDTNHDYTFMRQFIQTHWSALDLLPTVRYEQLIQILHHVDMSTDDKVVKLKRYLQQHLEMPVLSQFLLALIAYADEEESLSEVVVTVLEKGLPQSALNAALMQQLVDHSLQYIDLLLRYKADPNFTEEPSRFSPLQTVLTQFDMSEKRSTVVQSLLHHRADPNWRNQSIRRKVSAQARIRDEMEQVSAALAEELSDLSSVFAEGVGEPLTIWDFVRGERKKEPELIEDYQPRKTALHYACEKGSAEEIIALLDAGAETQLQDAEGNTALHLLIQDNYGMYAMNELNHAELVQRLLGKNASANQQNHAGDTPLHLYIRNFFKSSGLFNSKSTEVLVMLVAAKANITLANQKGNTVLHEMVYWMRISLTLGDIYHERACLLFLLVMNELTHRDLEACMAMENNAGERPEDFLKKMVVPEHVAKKLLNFDLDDEAGVVSNHASAADFVLRTEAEQMQSLIQQLADAELAWLVDVQPSQLPQEDSVPVGHRRPSYGEFFPAVSTTTARAKLTVKPVDKEREKEAVVDGGPKIF